MKAGAFFLASINGVFSDISPNTMELLAIFTGFVVVVALVLVWVLYFRKPSRPHHHHHRRSQARTQNAPENEIQEAVQPVVKKRRVRRSRHPQRPFNPTLAQTRGLPPLRHEGQQSTSQF
jgi:hypothetical protein